MVTGTTTDPTLAGLVTAIREHPDDDTLRLVYADRLDEIAGTVPCSQCDSGWRPKSGTPDPGMTSRCPHCNGSGTVSDADAARAEFVRVQVEAAILGAKADHGECDCYECQRYTMLSGLSDALLAAHAAEWFAVPGWAGPWVEGGELRWSLLTMSRGTPDRPAGIVRCTVSRGFLDAVTAPLDVLLPPCPVLESERAIAAGRSFTHFANCPACRGTGFCPGVLTGGPCRRCKGEGKYEFHLAGALCRDTCPDCCGEGRTGGVDRLPGPLCRVRVSDREPVSVSGGLWEFPVSDDQTRRNAIPWVVFDRFPEGRLTTADLAHAALGLAVASVARGTA